MNKKNYLKSVMAVVLLALICMNGRSVQAAETSEPHLSFKVSSDTFAESISGKWKTDKKGKRYLSVRSENKGKLLTGRQKISGKIYYFSPKTGQMVTGWTKIGKYKYYFAPKTGTLVTNRWIE